jgi:hypothetical protein
LALAVEAAEALCTFLSDCDPWPGPLQCARSGALPVRTHRRKVKMRKFLFTAAALCAFAAIALVGAATPGLASTHATPISRASTDGTPISRANAVRAAHEYLQFQAFSLKGLVGQLKYDGFSTSDATYGASHSGAHWMKQAVRAAKEYLRFQAFSRSGMIGQLKYDGFTSAQARHGAVAAGL